MSVAGAIDNLLKSPGFQQQLRAIQALAMSELQQAVMDKVYSQPEGNWYHRTFDLLNAVEVSDLVVTSSSIEFKVIFNPEKMNHTTLYGSKKYGLSPGDPVGGLIVPWLNEGWKWENYSGTADNFREREATLFLEEAIKKIQVETISRVKNAISVEVRKIGGRY